MAEQHGRWHDDIPAALYQSDATVTASERCAQLVSVDDDDDVMMHL